MPETDEDTKTRPTQLPQTTPTVPLAPGAQDGAVGSTSSASEKKPKPEKGDTRVAVDADKLEADDLKSRLKDLQKEAQAQFSNYRRTHDQLRSLLAKSYLWWRKAELAGCLKSLYREADIGFKKSSDGAPNFNPLLRLIFGVAKPTTADRVAFWNWSRALKVVHDDYMDNLEDFRDDAEDRLNSFIKERGGVAGLTCRIPKEEGQEEGQEESQEESQEEGQEDQRGPEQKQQRHRQKARCSKPALMPPQQADQRGQPPTRRQPSRRISVRVIRSK